MYPSIDTNVLLYNKEKPIKEKFFLSLNRFEKKKNLELAIHSFAFINN